MSRILVDLAMFAALGFVFAEALRWRRKYFKLVESLPYAGRLLLSTSREVVTAYKGPESGFSWRLTAYDGRVAQDTRLDRALDSLSRGGDAEEKNGN